MNGVQCSRNVMHGRVFEGKIIYYKILMSTVPKFHQLVDIVVGAIHKTHRCLRLLVLGVLTRPYGDIPNRSKFAYVVQVFVFQAIIVPYVPSIN